MSAFFLFPVAGALSREAVLKPSPKDRTAEVA